MALEEQVVLDQVEVLRDGTLQIRFATLIIKDGEEIAKTYHRHCKHPGEDCSQEHDEVQAIAGVIHTPEKVAKFQEKVAKLEAKYKDK